MAQDPNIYKDPKTGVTMNKATGKPATLSDLITGGVPQAPKSKEQQLLEMMDSIRETSAVKPQEPVPGIPAPPAPAAPVDSTASVVSAQTGLDPEIAAQGDALAERFAASDRDAAMLRTIAAADRKRERLAAQLAKEEGWLERARPPLGQAVKQAGSNLFDLVATIPRGAEGFVQGLYEAADFVTFDALPEPGFWEDNKRFLGRSENPAIRFLEDVTEFGIGFGTFGLGAASGAAKAGRAISAVKGLSKVEKVTNLLSKEGVAALDKLAREQRIVADSVKNAAKMTETLAGGDMAKSMQEAARQADKLSRSAARKALGADILRSTVAGAVTDYVLVPGTNEPTAQERMNNMLWGIAIGPAMQFGASSIVRMIRVNDTGKNLARRRLQQRPLDAKVGDPLTPISTEEAPLASGGPTATPEVPASPKTPVAVPEAPAAPHGPAVEPKNAPAWVIEEMRNRGLNPNRPFNDIDMADPKIRAALASDPNIQELAKTNPDLAKRALQGEVPYSEILEAMRVTSAATKVHPNIEAMRQLYGPEHAEAMVNNVWTERMLNEWRDILGPKFNPRDITPEERLALMVRVNSPNTKYYSGRKQGDFEFLRSLDTVSEAAVGMTNRRPGDWASLRQTDLETLARAKDVPESLFREVFAEGIEPTDAILWAGSVIRNRKEAEFKVAKDLAKVLEQGAASPDRSKKLDALQQYIFGLRVSAANKEALHALGTTMNSMKMRTGGAINAKERDKAIRRILSASAQETQNAFKTHEHNFLLKFEPLTAEELLDPKKVEARIQEFGGEDMVDGILRKGAEAKGMSGEEAAAFLDEAAKEIVRPSLKRVVTDLVYFGGFSGPASWARTLFGEGLYGLLFRPLSQAMGSGFGVAASLVLDRGETTKHHAKAIFEGLGDMWFLLNHRDQYESLSQAAKTYMTGRTGLVRNNVGKFDAWGSGLDEISGKNLEQWFIQNGVAPDSIAATRARAAGVAYEVGIKGLTRNSYLGVDQYIQQTAARSILRRHLTMQGLFEKDIPFDGIGRYVDEGMEKYLKDGELQSAKVRAREAYEKAQAQAMAQGLTDDQEIRALQDQIFKEMGKDIDNDVMELILRRAEDAALNAPIQSGTVGSVMEAVLRGIPGMFLFQPVLRTAWNTSRITGQMVDVPGFVMAMVANSERASLIFPELKNGWIAKSQNAFIRDFSSDNPKFRQEALGRFVMGLMMMTYVAGIATKKDEKGRPYLTGSAPRDPDMRNLWEQNGIIENAQLDLTTGKYRDRSMFSPVSNMVSLWTDTFQMLADPELDISEDELVATASALLFPLVNSLANEPLLGGMSRYLMALSDKDGSTFADKMAQVGAQTLFPNIFKQVGEAGFGSDPYIREARDLSEKIRARIPGVRDSLEVKRNKLGEKRKEKVMAHPLYPQFTSEVSNDPVDLEMLRIGSGIDNFPRYFHNVDLYKVKDPKTGQSALDYWGELTSTIKIGQLTLRNRLNRELHKPSYMRLPLTSKEGVRTERANRLGAIIDEYRARAYRQVTRRFPILQELEADYNRLRTGRSR